MNRRDDSYAFPNANNAILGMKLSDYFAAQALQALIAARPEEVESNPGALARDAYTLSEWMLRQRNK